MLFFINPELSRHNEFIETISGVILLPDMPNASVLHQSLKASLDENIEILKTIFNVPLNEDVIFRRYDAEACTICVV